MSFKTKIPLLLEVIMLAKQLEIYQRTDPKLKIKRTDRIFFSIMVDLLSNWKEKMFIVKPETVIKWHKTAFKFYWRWKSRPKGGRPKVSREVIALIKRMANDNPLWGAPRIHGELLKLGYEISESTVLRYLPKKGKRTTGQSWTTFLKNHAKEIISIDFLTVPTVNFKLLHVLVVIKHHRRKLIYFNVTKNPTAEWSIQQIRNMLFDYDAPKFLIRDRDKKYGKLLGGKKNQFGIDEIITAYRSPWQNGFCERVIGSIKRECLDHIIVLNENHLRSILTYYFSYYNKYRTHLGINKDSPEGRPIQSEGKIDKIPFVNGLHHYYFRQSA
jgi:transposase InsO family protein